MTDLLALTAELVEIPSVSHEEGAIADRLEAKLRAVPWLDVVRVGDNVVARTDVGRTQRLVIAGHTDTVPPSDGDRDAATIDGDRVVGVGAADMKSGLAVMVDLACSIERPSVDVTYVFYVCEEVEARHNGLGQLFETRPDLLAADAAVLAEPTGARVEAGCQGTLRVEVTMTGVRAHSARAWLGRNAIHRLGAVIDRLAAYEARTAVIGGCEYREGLQAVKVQGGVAGNVVPDRAVLTVNHRFAPDRSPAEAEAHVRDVVGEVDGFEVVDVSAGAPPDLDHPLLSALVAETAKYGPPRAKLGWTDVARFAARGVPATNFGPGDPELAHAAGEWVDRAALDAAQAALRAVLTPGP